MAKIREIVEKGKQDLQLILPEIATIEVLEHRADTIFTKGLKAMETILDGSLEEQNRIKAFNSVINFGRYLETRRMNQIQPGGMEFDDDDMVLSNG